MKKLLSILAAVGLTATASSAVVACTTTKKVELKADATDADFAKVFDKTVKDQTKYTKTNADIAKEIATKLGLDATVDANGKLKSVADDAKTKFDALTDDKKAEIVKLADKAVKPIIKSDKEVSLDAGKFVREAKAAKKDSVKLEVKLVTLGDLLKEAGDTTDKSTDYVLAAMVFAPKKGTFGLTWAADKNPDSIALTADQANKAFKDGNKDFKVTVTIKKAN